MHPGEVNKVTYQQRHREIFTTLYTCNITDYYPNSEQMHSSFKKLSSLLCMQKAALLNRSKAALNYLWTSQIVCLVCQDICKPSALVSKGTRRKLSALSPFRRVAVRRIASLTAAASAFAAIAIATTTLRVFRRTFVRARAIVWAAASGLRSRCGMQANKYEHYQNSDDRK